MAIEIQVRRIGDALGIVLPEEALAVLQAEEGSVLYLSEDAEGILRLSARQPELAEILEIAERGMRDYPNALRELAK